MVSGDTAFWKSKRVYEIVLPLAVTLILVGSYLIWPGSFSKTFLEDLSASIFQFMVFVVPFHLAALGAFATFDSKGLDEKLLGTNAQVRVWSNMDHGYFWHDLTLRQYASLLFGYLCSIGVVFIVLYVVVTNIRFDVLSGESYQIVYTIALAVVLFFVSHYAFLSIYAITFLFEKVNRIGGNA